MSTILKLPLASLKLNIDLAGFEFPEKSRIPSTILGQSRAQSALEFGIAMHNPGYNIFVMGEPGSGRLSMITQHLDALAQSLPTPPSYVYVDNFNNSREPVAIELPPEQGQVFSKAIEKLLDDVVAMFPTVLESPAYQQKKIAIERQFNHHYNRAIGLVDEKAQAMEIALFRENEAITFAPVRNNKALDEEEFSQLSHREREKFHRQVEELEDYLAEILAELPQWRRTMADQLKQLDSDTISLAIELLFNELDNTYQNIDDALTYLAEIKKNLEQTIAEFLMSARTSESPSNPVTKRSLMAEHYLPNILIDPKQESGAPVVYEPHPIYQNLFGQIEYVSDQGMLTTNYQRICAGALHRANGGYLILDAEKMLSYPFVWEGLKRALQTGRIKIESPYSELGINTVALKPEVIPLNVKVILVGSQDIYYLLEEMDSEFSEMFKILADFDNYIPLTRESIHQFARLIIRQAADSGSKPLTREAIESLLEHSCRISESQQHFSAYIKNTLDIIGEANLFCRHETHLDRRHIEQALAAREYRNGRMSHDILKEMLDGTILIDTEGEAIGKINGLTILEIGGTSFGAPARITTTVYPGSRGIIDIEREAELGQAIHSKGVLILTGYLGHFYAQQFPLAISASIAIEQSYSYIDGDSASLAELCCLISALTRTPIKQSFAITGSINQYGEVQAIGGVNEKIEGFFRLCQARGLTGHQAAIIPAANKSNLMLKQEVIDAVAQGLFAVYAVSSVDETLELLTGQSAGVLDNEGNYPENSINFKAISRLKEISELVTEDDKEEGL